MGETREFKNEFPEYSPEAAEKLGKGFRDALLTNIDILLHKLDSGLRTDTDWSDYSVYTGATGIALLYLHLSKVLGEERHKEFLEKALPYVEKPLQYARGRRVSFLCGDAGPLAIGAVFFEKIGNRPQSQELIKRLNKMYGKVIDQSSDVPDEILYGRAGYLYSLLYLKKYLGDNAIDRSVIKDVVDAIIQSGQKLSSEERHKCPLMYKWHNKHYLGAAHGVTGIMCMLMEAQDYISQGEMENMIRPTIDHLITLKFNSNNFPSSLGSSDDRLVHWCHGAPGYIHMLVKAHQIFGGEKYLNEAQNCADVIWARGLLRKGYGICHGISGNAYSFLILYRVTENPKYLYMAQKSVLSPSTLMLQRSSHFFDAWFFIFAEFCFDYGKHGCRIADRPLSLFEGLAGTIYFLADLLDPVNAAFPGFQLW